MELVQYSNSIPNPNRNLPWSEMFRSAFVRCLSPTPSPSTPPSKPSPETDNDADTRRRRGRRSSPLSLDTDVLLALYGGLALSLLLIYGLYRLLSNTRPSHISRTRRYGDRR